MLGHGCFFSFSCFSRVVPLPPFFSVAAQFDVGRAIVDATRDGPLTLPSLKRRDQQKYDVLTFGVVLFFAFILSVGYFVESRL